MPIFEISAGQIRIVSEINDFCILRSSNGPSGAREAHDVCVLEISQFVPFLSSSSFLFGILQQKHHGSRCPLQQPVLGMQGTQQRKKEKIP